MSAAAVAVAVLLTGCSMIPDKPTAYARKACFAGHINARGGAMAAGADASGDYQAVSIQTFGVVDAEAVRTIAATDCPEKP